MNIRVKIGDEIFEVEVGDLSARPILAKIDCDTFEVWPEEEMLVRPVQAASSAAASAPVIPSRPAPAAPAGNGNGNGNGYKKSGHTTVSAPIPGTIISVTVKPGDAVTHGQELCVLEAMKMKNAIRATRAGTIATIHVTAGDKVRHGQPLVEFTD